MLCPKCKNPVMDHAKFCENCGAKLVADVIVPSGAIQHQPQEEIKTYLLPALLVTFLCSPLFGLIAVHYSEKASAFLKARKYEKAKKSAETALMWCVLAFWIGLIFGMFLFLRTSLH